MKRREFLGQLGLVAILVGASKSVLASGLKLIDMTMKKRTDAANKTAAGIAKGLNYVSDVKAGMKAGKIKPADKMGVKAADQNCANCQFFKAQGDGGTCVLLQGVLVHKTGWCNSWTKKA